MDVARALRDARQRAGLSQAQLARLGGTSQATISAYESGRKQPSVETLGRLLSVMGARLTVAPARPAAARRTGTGRRLVEVLALAEALPTRHERELRFPRLSPAGGPDVSRAA